MSDHEMQSIAEVLGVAFGFLALLVAGGSLFVSLKAHRLARAQDERRRPLLVPTLLNAYVRPVSEDGSRAYAFLLSISNPTDSDNGVAALDLRVTYSKPNIESLIVRVPSDPSVGKGFAEQPEDHLSAPARLDAHQTLTGWCFVRVDGAMREGAAIEDYEVVLVDSHGIEVKVAPILVREYGEENEASSREAHCPT